MVQKIGGIVFALAVGSFVAWWAYTFNPTPDERAQRDVEEAMVMRARAAVSETLGGGEDLQIVDPLNPNRVAGKVYVYPVETGYEVSGYYRRQVGTFWMPWLVRLNDGGEVIEVSAAGPDGPLELPVPANDEVAEAPR